MTWDRLRMAGYLLAFVLVGAMLISLYGAFRVELEKSSYIGFIGGIVLGAAMITLIMIVLLVPEQRRAGWVHAITNVNARYLFGGLIVLWIVAMGFLASLNLSANSVGPPALVGMFAGIFIFMGFIGRSSGSDPVETRSARHLCRDPDSARASGPAIDSPWPDGAPAHLTRKYWPPSATSPMAHDDDVTHHGW